MDVLPSAVPWLLHNQGVRRWNTRGQWYKAGLTAQHSKLAQTLTRACTPCFRGRALKWGAKQDAGLRK